MKIRTTLIICLLFLTSFAVNAQQDAPVKAGTPTSSAGKTDVTGTWKCEAETSAGSYSPTFTFKQDGETLTGQYQGSFGESAVTGTVKGTEIKFSFPIESNGEKATVFYSGIVEGDSMKGEVELDDQGGIGTFKGKREAAVSVTGKWNLEVEFSGGVSSPVFTFKQDGEKLTGTYQGMLGEATVTGTLTGNEIKFSFSVDAYGEKVTVSYSGTVEGDSMKGEFGLGDEAQFGTFTGKRETAVNVSGTWSFQVETDAGSGWPTFTFEQEGEKLTGQYQGSFGEAPVTGTVKGNKIEFAFDLDAGGTAATIRYSGTVEGDKMEGEVQYGENVTGTFTAKRE